MAYINREEYVLPPSSKLFFQLAKTHPMTFKLTHFFWDFDELYEIIIHCVKKFVVFNTAGEAILSITDPEWRTVFGSGFRASELKQRIMSYLIASESITLRENSFLFNPSCECDDCTDFIALSK